jgi:hypothetical protein
MSKICNMAGVREYTDGDAIEHTRHDGTGRLVIRAFNECGNNYTQVDLLDLIEWLKSGPHGVEFPLLPSSPSGRSHGSDGSNSN